MRLQAVTFLAVAWPQTEWAYACWGLPQGLKWYRERLREDCDGNTANEILMELTRCMWGLPQGLKWYREQFWEDRDSDTDFVSSLWS